MKQANLELNIEQLQLPDLPYGQRIAVAAALEQELTRLWSEQGAPAGLLGDSLALSFAHIEVSAGAPPEVMGAQAAQALYQRLAGANLAGAGGQ
jgi:hypothetical protein